MTLNKRVLLVIFPVILLCSLVTGFYFLRTQEVAITHLEEARLSQQVGNLRSIFLSELDFNRSFLQSIVGSDTLRLFLEEEDDSYRISAIGARLLDNIRNLASDTSKFASVAIFEADGNLRYYFENSEDPFAEVGNRQRDYAKNLFLGSEVTTWSLIRDDSGNWTIINSQFIDPITYAKPLPGQIQTALLVQTVVKLEQFEVEKQKIIAEIGATIELGAKRQNKNDPIEVSVKLDKDLYINILSSGEHFRQRLTDQRLFIFGWVSVISILSIALLIYLMRRYIIDPVTMLGKQVTGVMDGTLDGISELKGSGEVSDLSSNVKLMYDNLKQSLSRIQRMSWVDPLTGINNRAFFTSEAEKKLVQAGQNRSSYTLFFIDLDNFKFVNDRYGHLNGDQLLKTFATSLGNLLNDFLTGDEIRETVFARLSGDEFAILLPKSANDPEAFGKAILSFFDHGFEVGGYTYPVTASIGWATYPVDARTLDDLVSKADTAMYQAKEQGKNNCARYSASFSERGDRQRLLLAELRLLNPDDEFNLVYMPIVDRHGQVQRLEALLRWTSPSLGVVSPGEFIPVAESNGLFSKIDFWVASRAARDFDLLQTIYSPDVVLSVNLSSAELLATNLATELEKLTGAYNVPPASIEFELSETISTASLNKATETLKSLRNVGYKISIDDFGAGYTSLHQIIDYPADTVKLDMAIVRKLAVPDQAAVLAQLIGLCHARGMSVVAEGVDTTSKWDVLEAAGCDLFQGYLISQPKSLETLASEKLRTIANAPEINDRPKAHYP